MKKIILALAVLCCLFTKAQTVEEYYDWQWEPCEPGLSRFYSIIKTTDSGWLRFDYFTANNKLQMAGLYQDKDCKIKNGSFVYFNSNGNVSSTGRYINDKLDGIWLSFYYSGLLNDSTVYAMDEPTGTSLGWHENGYMSDSSVYNPDGHAVHAYWFDNGLPSAAGKTFNDKKEGRWMYFHKNGKTAAMEDYQEDKLISKTYFDEEGKELTGKPIKDRDAEFNGGIPNWQRYLQKNLVFPQGYMLVNTHIITIVIAATIDEEGNVESAFVEIPFKPAFDDEALRVVKRSPKWKPAVNHNRRVKMFIRQPVSFKQVVE